MQIGYIKSPAKAGDRITVYFPNGKSSRFVANNDLTSTTVVVMGDRAFSQDAQAQKLTITTRLFKSKNNYDGSVKYPYLSVFINSNSELVATYNGGQRILGNIPFSQLTSVNLNHFGNGIFTGFILSQNKTQVVRFDNIKIEPVVNISIIPNPWITVIIVLNSGGGGENEYNFANSRKLSGNVIFDQLNQTDGIYGFAFKFTPEVTAILSRKYLQPFAYSDFSRSNNSAYFDPFADIRAIAGLNRIFNTFDSQIVTFYYFGQPAIPGAIYPYNPVFTGNPFANNHRTGLTVTNETYTYNENRTISNYGRSPESFSNKEINWSYEITGNIVIRDSDYYNYLPAEQNSPPLVYNSSNTLTSVYTTTATQNTDLAIEFPSVYKTDGSVLGNTKVIYRDNFSRTVDYNSNFNVDTETRAIVRAYTTGTFFGSLNYEYVGSTTTKYSGQAVVNDTAIEDSLAQVIHPVPVCDHRIVETGEYFKKDISRVFGWAVSANNFNILGFFAPYVDSGGLVDTHTIVYEETEDFKSTKINFVFNVGDLGIYLEKTKNYNYKNKYTASYPTSSFSARLMRTLDTSPPENQNESLYNYIELRGLNLNQNYKPSGGNQVVQQIPTKDMGADFSFYKIAYLDNEPITATPGYASGSYTLTPEKIANFFLDSNSDSSITLSVSGTQYLNYISKITTQSTTTYQRTNYPSDEINNFNLEGELVVYKQTYQDNTYLALCRVRSLFAYTYLPNGETSDRQDYRILNSLNCTIISVKKIKSFFTTQSFVFTVDGCAIFRFLDPYKTNLITVENDDSDPDVYLAATMVTSPPPLNKPVVTEQDTQALLFKLTEAGFTFVAVVGGDISDPSQEKSPDAAYWIKYWERPVTSFF